MSISVTWDLSARSRTAVRGGRCRIAERAVLAHATGSGHPCAHRSATARDDLVTGFAATGSTVVSRLGWRLCDPASQALSLPWFATDCGTARIQMTIRAFLRDLRFYRSYLNYPQLGLPQTTNSVESMGRLLREMFRRNRAGSNPASTLRWATAFIRIRPTVACNSK